MKDNTIIFKALLFLLALTCFSFAKAQEPCEITCNVEMPVCSESPVTLSVPPDYQYTYHWLPGGQNTYSITVKPFASTTYTLEVHDATTDTLVCRSQYRVEVLPRFEMNYQQVKLTCSNHEEENGRTAQVLAAVDSLSAVYEPPFDYQWQLSP